jgi:acetylornithine/succinyldiaminopimelate/putrescine aminotransferase
MNTNQTIALEDAYQLPTYKKMPVAVARGEGCYVWDVEGQRFLDFYGGHCVTALGHCPEKVVTAVQQQAATLMFYSNAVYSPVRAQAAASLCALAPDGLGHVFFCNSGTEANETALKLARKWTGKSGLVAMVGGFHGRTLGSLAATWNPRYRTPHKAVLPHTHFVAFGDLEEVEALLTSHEDIAAVILEPIQSMAGVLEAPAEYFRALRALCNRSGVALIFDEIQTGVGRTGTFSISEQLGVVPDLITLAKSLGSGVPVGAVLASDAVAEAPPGSARGAPRGASRAHRSGERDRPDAR